MIAAMSRKNLGIALALLALGPLLSACGGEEDQQTITVLAAASLTDTFEQLAADFEASHEGVDVRLAFDSSATLAAQAAEGADADILATADTTTMGEASDAGAVRGEATVFATNTATLVVPADNPADITTVTDLDRDGVVYVVCVETAPCGKAAAALLPAAGVTAPPASEEVDVKAVLAKVTSGEADAGVTYVTDAVAAGDAVRTVELPGAEDARQEYPIALLTQTAEPDLAQEFLDLVLSEQGRQVLAEAGFGPVA